jgi:uncharacterized protein with GYD domain
MPKYIVKGDYTPEGLKGLIKEGGTSRKEAVSKLAASVDGSLESFHYCAGSPTYFVVFNLPNKTAVTAIAAAIVASGAVTITECVELLTPAEMDEAVKKTPSYRAPGH